MSKQPIALTVIFSFLLSSCDGENQLLCRQPELINFIYLNRAISDAFDVNETFWLWYINYAFNCRTCIADGIRLKKVTSKIIPRSSDNFCFWKRECKVQIANRRLRRQWSIKFANRVLTHNNVPIIWEEEPTHKLIAYLTETYDDPKSQKKVCKLSKVPSPAFPSVSPAGG